MQTADASKNVSTNFPQTAKYIIVISSFENLQCPKETNSFSTYKINTAKLEQLTFMKGGFDNLTIFTTSFLGTYNIYCNQTNSIF